MPKPHRQPDSTRRDSKRRWVYNLQEFEKFVVIEDSELTMTFSPFDGIFLCQSTVVPKLATIV